MVAVAVPNGACKKKLDIKVASLSTVARKMRTKLQSLRSVIKAVSEEWGAVKAVVSVTWVLDFPSDVQQLPRPTVDLENAPADTVLLPLLPAPPLHRPCRHVAWLRHASNIVQLLSSHGLFYNCECGHTHAYRAINTVSVT